MKDNKGVIYPCGTKEEFDSKWYIASGFGEKRSSTWYHSGADFNLKTGGNTDLNHDLFAIADGEILTTRYRSTGFGNVLTMKFLLNGKTFYALYAHLNGFNSKAGDVVKKGERICRLGNSGNSSLAHLHFSIKNTANGIDNIPNTPEELKQWEDPMKFIKDNYGVSSNNDNMQSTDDIYTFLGIDNFEDAKKKLIEHLGEKDKKCNWGADRGAGHLGAERYKNEQLTTDLKTCQETKKAISSDLESCKTNSEKYIDGLVYLLNPDHTQYKGVSKPDMVEIEVKKLIDNEQKRLEKERELQQAIDDAKQAKAAEIEALKAEIEDLKRQLERVSDRVDDVEKDSVITQPEISVVKKFINKIINMWKKS